MQNTKLVEWLRKRGQTEKDVFEDSKGFFIIRDAEQPNKKTGLYLEKEYIPHDTR